MPVATQYFVQPYELVSRNTLKPLLPIPASGREHADRMAQRLSSKGGAIAASLTGDPESGDYSEAEIIAMYGDLPDGVVDANTA